MADDRKDGLAIRLSRCLRVEEEVLLRVEDGAPVLHRSSTDLARSCNQIEFWQRVTNAEVIVVVVQERSRLFQGVGSLREVAMLDDNANVRSVYTAMHTLVIPHTEKERVGGHLRGGRELDPLISIVQRSQLGNGHIGHGDPVLGGI